MDYYQLSVQDTLNNLHSTADGLSEQQASLLLAQNGKNKLADGKKQSLVVKFLKQLADPMIIILLVAATVSLVLTLVNNSNPNSERESFADVIIIIVVVLLNATLGVTQESKAEHAIKALQSMAVSRCKVLRNGEMKFVDSQDIVIGDVLLFEAGDSVPADCRIIEAVSCKAEESALTGESVPVDKNISPIDKIVALGDRKNMLYMGSSVVYGRAKAVVVATAMASEMGKIANILATAKEERTPLQIKMAQLSKILTYVVVEISVFIFAFKLLMSYIVGEGFGVAVVMNSLLVAIGLAVAAIPEGLATVVTVVLSIGVTNMSKKNAIIRKMTAVETLGCTEIICSDKTGTLTQNKMTVVDSYASDTTLLAKAMALCCDAQLTDGVAVGEPTERALVNFALANGLNKQDLEMTAPRIAEAPFDSLRKMMSTIHQTSDGIIQYTKGAPDEILERCTHVYNQGNAVPLTEEIKSQIEAENKRMANNALRVLAVAYKHYTTAPSNTYAKNIEMGLIFVGLCGMIDPVRPEVQSAIERSKQAGIRPIVISGDHIDTAVAIAMQLGIITDSSQAILGSSLDDMSDEELANCIENYSVYARVQPEHKARIVNAWKAKGKVCAMTGDGVNDAPSIKSADIGVGMGITGTDVTKNTADMILADDNFATIVTAVGEGRRIYDNIRKAIQFLLSSNLAEVLAVFISTLCGFVLLKPAHLLWINLITDTFPAIALGMEKAESDVMTRPPRKKDEGIFSNGLGANVIIHGVMIAAITLAVYFVGSCLNGASLQSEQGVTMAFVAMSMTEVFHAYNARSMNKSIFRLKTHNLVLWAAMILSLALTTAVVYVPGLNTAFGFVTLTATEYFISLAMAFAIIPLVEIQKLIVTLRANSKQLVFTHIYTPLPQTCGMGCFFSRITPFTRI